MNDILDVITSRRSVKSYKTDLPTKEEINKVIKAGTYAPTGRNLQSPIIVAITNKEVRDRLSYELAKTRNLNDFDPFYGAPVILVVLANKEVGTYVYDGSVVMENMLLEAHSLNLGACWIHGAKQVFETEFGKDLLLSLGISGNYEGIGHCILGYPLKKPTNTLPRKSDYVYYVD